MKGDAIADGPVPFIFGAKAEKMKQRYWIHDVTPKEEVGKRVWLEVFPKFQHDAMNFEKATVTLNDADFTIYALQIYHPGQQQRTVFMFSKVVNNPYDWLGTEFAAPKTPWNWTKEVDPVDAAPAQPEPKATAEATTPRQAKRTAPVAPTAAGGTVKR
jgi:hypothetical protein